MKKINIKVAENDTCLNVDSIEINFTMEDIEEIRKQSLVFNDYPKINSINISELFRTVWLYEENPTDVKLEHENLVITKDGSMFLQIHTSYTGDILESELFSLNYLIKKYEE